jgi:hypothetical protein
VAGGGCGEGERAEFEEVAAVQRGAFGLDVTASVYRAIRVIVSWGGVDGKRLVVSGGDPLARSRDLRIVYDEAIKSGGR